MKKLLAGILALVMVFGLAVTASAAGGSMTIGVSGTPADIGDVEVTVTEGETINTYYVIVAWDDLTFTYAKNNRRWDAENHKYVNAGGGTFTDGATANITVTNKSDVSITVTAAAEDKNASDGFKATLNKTTFDLGSYADLAVDAPASNTFTITVTTDGTPSAGTTAVADISVTIANKS